MVLSSLCGPHMLVCLTTSVHAPHDKADGVLGNLLPDLDQDIIEILEFEIQPGSIRKNKT